LSASCEVTKYNESDRKQDIAIICARLANGTMRDMHEMLYAFRTQNRQKIELRGDKEQT